jgi:hypothetical protein
MRCGQTWAKWTILGLLVLCSCSSGKDSTTGTSLSTGQEATENLEGTSVTGDSAGNGAHRFFGIPGPLGNEAIPEGCPYDAASGWFVCATETDEHGAAVTRSHAFRDAGGEAQSSYDEAATAAIESRLTLKSHPERDGHRGTIEIEHDLIASGLVGEETSRTWNGTIHERFEGVPPNGPGGPGGPGGAGGHNGPGGPGGPGGAGGHNGPGGPGGPGGSGGHNGPGGPGGPGHPGDGPATPPDSLPADFDPSRMIVTVTTVVSDVVMPHPLGRETWPVSGTIARTEVVENGPRGNERRTSEIAYNGTRFVTLTVDGETRTIDLLQPPRPPRP